MRWSWTPAWPAMSPAPDRRSVLVELAGLNGAGKATFYHAHFAAAGLRFVKADERSPRSGTRNRPCRASATAG